MGPPVWDDAQFFSDLVRCETRLYNALDGVLSERHGIAASQFEFLQYIRDHPASRVADLAAAFAIGVGATSKGVDRLERRTWVIRTVSLTDRRSSLLQLTHTGRSLVDEAEATFRESLTGLLAPVRNARHAGAMLGAFAILRASLEDDGIGTPIG